MRRKKPNTKRYIKESLVKVKVPRIVPYNYCQIDLYLTAAVIFSSASLGMGCNPLMT